MSASSTFKIGLVGAGGRGGSFRKGIEAVGARIHAICDVNAQSLDASRRVFEIEPGQAYTDYQQMLGRSGVDAVILGTPMQFHAPQAIAALERDIHAMSEVTAAVSLDEAKRLVAAAKKSKATYMMAENYTYMKPNVFVRELVRRGLFGEVYYAEGEYIHELKQLNEDTPWRRTWQTGVDGVTYGTHSLGPILQWFGGDRVVRVSCEGTGSHHKDPRGKPYHQDTAVMLCKTARGRLIKIRVDMLSDRPSAMTNYQLQGVDGAYESSRGGPGDRHKIWLRTLSKNCHHWFDLDTLMETDEPIGKVMPESWRNPSPEAIRAGHGGGDYFEILDFVRACRGEAKCPIGIHEAMDMTLPGLISQDSIKQHGAWLDVPDSRTW